MRAQSIAWLPTVAIEILSAVSLEKMPTHHKALNPRPLFLHGTPVLLWQPLYPLTLSCRRDAMSVLYCCRGKTGSCSGPTPSPSHRPWCSPHIQTVCSQYLDCFSQWAATQRSFVSAGQVIDILCRAKPEGVSDNFFRDYIEMIWYDNSLGMVLLLLVLPLNR